MPASAYAHLSKWVARGTPPPTAPPPLFNADRPGPGRHPRVAAPTAVKDGNNSDESSCRLCGAHIPFEEVAYLAAVVKADTSNIRKGYLNDATR